MNVLKAIQENSKDLEELKNQRIVLLKKIVEINAEIAALSTITDFATLHNGNVEVPSNVPFEDITDARSKAD